MNYTVKRRLSELRITIDDANFLEHSLLKFFVRHKIRDDKIQLKELRKVNKVSIESSGKNISIKLKPKEWEFLNVQEIKKCIDYALANITSDEEINL